MTSPVNADHVTRVAREVLGNEGRTMNANAEDRMCRSFFGAPAAVIATLWNRLQPLDSNAKLKHLLWSLVFLFVYSMEEVHCRIVGWPNAKTYRKWTWYMLEKIAALKDEVISLNNHFQGYDG